jgi:hypothetical protein
MAATLAQALPNPNVAGRQVAFAILRRRPLHLARVRYRTDRRLLLPRPPGVGARLPDARQPDEDLNELVISTARRRQQCLRARRSGAVPVSGRLHDRGRFWTLTPKEAVALRVYLQKGGFIIFDFRAGFLGGGGWKN